MEKAVAIKYSKNLPAPYILAKGKAKLAQMIRQIAKDHDITIMNMPQLTDELIELDIGSLIPEEYYEIIAQILIFVFNLKVKQ